MIRKIIKIGNSEGVTIPTLTMKAYKLKVGDKVEVYVGKPDSEAKYIELLKGYEDFRKKYDQTLKNLAKS